MTKATSILLDFLRFAAAIIVAFGHLTQAYFSQGWPDLTIYAKSAVSIFFVLSGFVISYVTTTKEKTPGNYFISRISRLYSVLVPAILLSGVVLIIAMRFDPTLVHQWSGEQSSLHFLQVHRVTRFVFQSIVSLLFLNSIHGHETCPGVISPIWSLSFEAAYYILFGIALFTRGYRRILLTIVCCVIFGLGMIWLLPVWLAGVLVHRLTRYLATTGERYPIFGTVNLGVVGAAALYWPSYNNWVDRPHQAIVQHVLHGQGRAIDAGVFYYWGLAAAALLVAAFCFDEIIGKLVSPLEVPIRWLASHTFSIYLFHFPLLILVCAVTHYDKTSSLAKILAFVAVISACMFLSRIGEDKKHWWRSLFSQTLATGRLGWAKSRVRV
jgi:peptidoglycan/LPS O-acetylase OafA/YrhL